MEKLKYFSITEHIIEVECIVFIIWFIKKGGYNETKVITYVKQYFIRAIAIFMRQ